MELQSKEGIALINGTQFMAAYGIYALLKTQKLRNSRRNLYEKFRLKAAFNDNDRVLHTDIKSAVEFLQNINLPVL